MKPFSVLLLLILLGAAVHVVSAEETYPFTAKWGSMGFTDGQFYNPWGIAVDGAGNVYVADTANNRVQKFDAAGNFITKWGRFGASDGQFQYPRGIAIDSNGAVFVIDATGLVQTFTSTGTFVSKWTTGDGSLSTPPERHRHRPCRERLRRRYLPRPRPEVHLDRLPRDIMGHEGHG